MASGGRRPGAGRPKGSVTKKTQDIAAQALADGVSPLEVMLIAMRRSFDQGDFAGAAAFAKDAAPFCHPRFNAVAHVEIQDKPAIDDMSNLEKARRVAYILQLGGKELDGQRPEKPVLAGQGMRSDTVHN
jgi:hypothetical protein